MNGNHSRFVCTLAKAEAVWPAVTVGICVSTTSYSEDYQSTTRKPMHLNSVGNSKSSVMEQRQHNKQRTERVMYKEQME